MSRYTLDQRWEILKIHFQTGESFAETVRKLRTNLGRKEVPSAEYVRQFVKRVRETGSLLNKTTRARARPVRSNENISVVAKSVREKPNASIRHRARELNISRTSLRRILQNDLGMEKVSK